MHIKSVNLETVCGITSKIPEHDKLEIAFAGKSNVGKSSVINRLLQRKNFARVGSAPGKTVHINYFLIDNTAYFVDLPGYGYAKVNDVEKLRWSELMEGYFKSNRNIKMVFSLIDMRHPATDFDLWMPGILYPASVLTGPETRTTSPVRIERDEKFSSSISGLYPIGEGAGYSGGIISSARDGVMVAKAILEEK